MFGGISYFIFGSLKNVGTVFVIVFVTAYSTAAYIYFEMQNSSFKADLTFKWSVFDKAIYQPATSWHDAYDLFNLSLPNFWANTQPLNNSSVCPFEEILNICI